MIPPPFFCNAVLQYVDAPDSDLVCAVCQSPFQNAVEIDECGHMFCDRCVRRWIGTNPTCPVCRVRLHPSQLRPANRVIKNLVKRERFGRWEGWCVCVWVGWSVEHPCGGVVRPDLPLAAR